MGRPACLAGGNERRARSDVPCLKMKVRSKTDAGQSGPGARRILLLDRARIVRARLEDRVWVAEASRSRYAFLNCILLAVAAVLTGCSAPAVRQQRLVAKPNMVFSVSPVFSYSSSVLPQLETGSAMSGGAQNAGCTSCR